MDSQTDPSAAPVAPYKTVHGPGPADNEKSPEKGRGSNKGTIYFYQNAII
jgi:hypothetical protein